MEEGKKKGPFAAFRLLDVAAWLQCSAEIPPLSCSLDNACRPRLAASLCLPLYIHIYIYIYHCLLIQFLSFNLLFSLFSLPSSVSFSFFSYLATPLCLPGTQREKGGLGAVCLKPSRINLLRPSTVRKDCISQFPLTSLFLFCLNAGHLIREKWLPSLFSFLP